MKKLTAMLVMWENAVTAIQPVSIICTKDKEVEEDGEVKQMKKDSRNKWTVIMGLLNLQKHKPFQDVKILFSKAVCDIVNEGQELDNECKYMQDQEPEEHLGRFFAKALNGFQSLTISTKKAHHRSRAGS